MDLCTYVHTYIHIYNTRGTLVKVLGLEIEVSVLQPGPNVGPKTVNVEGQRCLRQS